jgi:ABC-type proline/glycine betaine transport system ATPase subunit
VVRCIADFIAGALLILTLPLACLFSALDSESESIVQAALDRLMESREHTTLVIAHRLSTIAKSDKIAFIADGKVIEYGSPEELLKKKHGRYKRLVESQKRGATLEALLAKQKKDDTTDEEEEDDEVTKSEDDEVEEVVKSFNAKRARQLASPDASYIALGKYLEWAYGVTWCHMVHSISVQIPHSVAVDVQDPSGPSWREESFRFGVSSSRVSCTTISSFLPSSAHASIFTFRND